MALPAFVLLCGLAALSFSAAANHPRQAWSWALAGLITLYLLQHSILVPESSQVAMLVVLAVAACLGFPHYRLFSVVAGGIMTAFWLISLQATGVPLLLAALLAAGSAALALALACQRPAFCPESLLLEARVIVLIAALLSAIVPGLLSGWLSGLNIMQGQRDADTLLLMDPLVLLLPLLSAVLGVIYTTWKKR